jgi:hypothetical protein
MSAVLDAALANVYPLRKAQADAADALAGLLDYARTINLPAASEAHSALRTALKDRSSRFAHTSCSQCGCDLGPGDSGVSSCIEHIKIQRPVVKPISPAYAEFWSEYLQGNVRIGYEWHDAQDHFFMPSLAGVELNEILVGGIDLGQHIVNTTLSVLQAELREHLIAANAW